MNICETETSSSGLADLLSLQLAIKSEALAYRLPIKTKGWRYPSEPISSEPISVNHCLAAADNAVEQSSLQAATTIASAGMSFWMKASRPLDVLWLSNTFAEVAAPVDGSTVTMWRPRSWWLSFVPVLIWVLFIRIFAQFPPLRPADVACIKNILPETSGDHSFEFSFLGFSWTFSFALISIFG